jgi:hypothetical protein
VNVFYVKKQFLSFTHWVAISDPRPWIFHEPAYPGDEPARDMTCLTGR